MTKVRREDYENIANIFNESGDKAAIEYIVTTYGTKAPKGVISRIKKSPGFKYDAENKKIIKCDLTEEGIFMDLDELCNNTESNKKEVRIVHDSAFNTIESLYIELMQEKLLELMKYVKLNHNSSTISINKSALITDGYKINFNEEISGQF